ETGYVVYSVYKEVDFATSLRNGPYSSTNFANVFKEAANAGSVDPVFLTDFEEYVPSYNAPASFISSPIFDGNDLIGVLVFQMPVDKINDVMTSNHRWKDVGLGDSGETYLVAEDMTLRSNSRFLIDDKEGYLEALSNTSIRKDVLDHIAKTDNSIGLQPVNTHSAHEAIGGKDGAEIVDDYRGVPVLSAYAPVDIDGVNWGILAEIDEAEAFASLSALKKITFIIALIIAGIVAVVGVLVARSIARPISRIIDEMSEGSSQVASASVQLAGSSQSLSEGASEQASSLEETSASLEEISSMVKQNAENSTQASQLAIGARTTAEKGSDSVTSMVTAMTEINQSSEEVSKIIKVINEIAFQTNLLALNAAVEAARAGEHGKGFAVVAEEVRNLAKRSAEAAKETGGLIESSVNKAKDGSKLAEEAGVILTEIVTNNKKVEDLVGEITAASKEQSDGLDQVTKALMQMDQVTQAVSANSEETSASSEELSAQSDGLKSMVMNLAQVIGGEKATAGGGDHLTRTRRHNDDDDDNGKYHVEVDAHALGGGKNPNTVRAVTGLEKQKTKTKETLPLDDDFKDF
ncbi:MAG: methyl-accepting chemotaxis protein, partial [Deltaproteobacteria bacterium]|nr:methyl-accepting chemotaxis protein [Deltaproteobacteria bacterium]